MSTRSSRSRPSALEASPTRTRKGTSPTRSPARKKKVSPPASPTRKSPSRKSPSRKPASKFPARKSPSRSNKETKEAADRKSPFGRPSIKEIVKEANVKTVNDLNDLQYSFRETRTRRAEYSIKDLTVDVKNFEINIVDKLNGLDSKDSTYSTRNRKPVEDNILRRSNRIRDYVDNVSEPKKSVSKSFSKSISKSVEFSDGDYSEEELPKREQLSTCVTRKLATPLKDSISKLNKISGKWEFGGRIGSAILIFLIPLVLFILLAICTKSCFYKDIIDLNLYKNVSWYGYFSWLVVLSQAFLQSLFVVFPIFAKKTEKVDEFGRIYRFNAALPALLTTILLFTLDFLRIIDSNMILNQYFQLALASYVFAVLLCFALYLRSSKLEDSKRNSYGNSGYVLYDFWMGREIQPYFYNVNIKIWISRICNINSLILCMLLCKHSIKLPVTSTNNFTLENFKDIFNKLQYNPTVIFFAMAQLIYTLYFIMREYKMTATFFWQYEGVGYLQAVASALYPFYFTTISKYIVDNNVQLSNYTLITCAVVFLLGFTIMLSSNKIKYDFRTNPQNPKFYNLETMPTYHGKRLLVCGLWGMVRHPNYLGDILIQTALAVPAFYGTSGVSIVVLVPIISTVVLLHRAWRDHSRCQRRYAAAWTRYCKRVPSAIIPKVV